MSWSGLKESSRLTSLPANAVDPSQGELDLELDLGRKPSPLGGIVEHFLDDHFGHNGPSDHPDRSP